MGILIKNNIVNQKGTPAFYESSLATRPVANIQGRMFIDTDVPSTGIYRDNGTSWNQVADPGAGTTGTLQQVTTNGSSTTIGISTSGNGIGIGTTIPGSNRLDIHSSTGIQATFNGTGTTNAALQLQLAGVGKWNLSNLYNSAANDFIINDVVNSLNRVTVKNTGQTFIGTDTTSSGLFVVNSSTSDNHYVAIGSNAPSYRLRDVGSGGALNCGIGISTAVNNFIQSSVSGDYCIFNSSTTASPILFGVYNGTNTVEAVRISAARNLMVGTVGIPDNGAKLQIQGTSTFSGTINSDQINVNTASNPIAIFKNNVSDGSLIQFQNPAASTLYRWFIGSNYNNTNSFEIICSTIANGNIPSSTSLLTLKNTGALSGTSASFSSSGLPLTLSTSAVRTDQLVLTQGAFTQKSHIGNFSGNTYLSTNWFYNGSNTFDDNTLKSSSIVLNQDGSINLNTNNVVNTAPTTALTLASTGAATFSSSIAISNTVTASVLNTVTNKVSIIIGGVQYYLLASTSAV
jgi:hypothetical protein